MSRQRFKDGLSVLSCGLPAFVNLHLEHVFVSRTLNKGSGSTERTVEYVWITITSTLTADIGVTLSYVPTMYA